MWTQQGRGAGEDHLPQPVGHVLFKVSQDSLLVHKGTLLAHRQLVANQNSQVLLCKDFSSRSLDRYTRSLLPRCKALLLLLLRMVSTILSHLLNQ